MIAEIEEQKNNATLGQTNKLLFQQFREKYERMRLEKEQQKKL